MSARARGDRATVLFVIQREDAEIFTPNDTTDPTFGATLRAAAAADVQVRAVRCHVTQESICLDRQIPVQLDDDLADSYNRSRSEDSH
jgi:sugar fermentation stimulation protein A